MTEINNIYEKMRGAFESYLAFLFCVQIYKKFQNFFVSLPPHSHAIFPIQITIYSVFIQEKY